MDAPVRRVMVGTDRSETADQAVPWAASFAERYGAELIVVQIVVSHSPVVTEYGAAERTRAVAAGDDLALYARQLAGERGRALVIVDDDPAMAIVRAAEQEAIDVLVVGNVGMAGRKEFLLGNIPNRISHNARCTVVIVNTFPVGDRTAEEMPTVIRSTEPAPSEPRLMARDAQIAAVMSKHGLQELFDRSGEPGTAGRRRQAKRLRAALEELGPTYSKLGQVLPTRPDLLPAEAAGKLLPADPSGGVFPRRAATLESTIHQAGRQLALGLTAGAAGLATGLTAMSTGVADWVPVTFGVIGGVLTLGLLIDLVRQR